MGLKDLFKSKSQRRREKLLKDYAEGKVLKIEQPVNLQKKKDKTQIAFIGKDPGKRKNKKFKKNRWEKK